MDNQSLAHSKYNCIYHIVWIPKYRRKALFGEYRREMGEIIGRICKLEGESRLFKPPLGGNTTMPQRGSVKPPA